MPSCVLELKNTFLSFSDSPQPNYRRSQTLCPTLLSGDTLLSDTGSVCSIPSPLPLSPMGSSRMKVLDDYVASVAEESMQTTVMIWGIPKSYTQEMLLSEVSAEGLPINFLYLPHGKTKNNRSYGFVNFESEADAKLFLSNFKGHKWSAVTGRAKPATVGYATLQGYTQHVEQDLVTRMLKQDVTDRAEIEKVVKFFENTECNVTEGAKVNVENPVWLRRLLSDV